MGDILNEFALHKKNKNKSEIEIATTHNIKNVVQKPKPLPMKPIEKEGK